MKIIVAIALVVLCITASSDYQSLTAIAVNGLFIIASLVTLLLAERKIRKQ
jgi:hypothetical protein